jgi:hypothetical protein
MLPTFRMGADGRMQVINKNNFDKNRSSNDPLG